MLGVALNVSSRTMRLPMLLTRKLSSMGCPRLVWVAGTQHYHGFGYFHHGGPSSRLALPGRLCLPSLASPLGQDHWLDRASSRKRRLSERDLWPQSHHGNSALVSVFQRDGDLSL